MVDGDRALGEDDFTSGATEDRYPDHFGLTRGINGGGDDVARATVADQLAALPHHQVVLGHDVQANADFLAKLAVQVQFDGHAAGLQPRRVAQVLVAEDVEFGGRDEGGRQAGEVRRARGCAVRRHLVGAGAVPEEQVPGQGVGRAVPDADVGDLVTRSGGVAVIEHRVAQRITPAMLAHVFLAVMACAGARKGGGEADR